MSFRTQLFLIVFLLLSVNARARVVAPRFSKSAILAGLVSSNRNYSHKWAYQADAPNANIVANYGNAATLEALEGMRLTTRGWCFNSRWGSLSWIWDGIDFDATAANFTDKLITLGMRTTSVAITCYESEDDSDIGAAKFILLSVRPNEDVKFKMSVFRADRAVREFAEIENTSMRPGDEVCVKDTDPTADSYRRFKAYHRLVGETEWTEISTSALVGTSPQSGFSCLSAGAGRLPEGNHQFRVVVEPFQNHLPKRANYNFNVKVIAPPSPSPSPSPTPTPTRTPTPTPTPTPTRTPSPTPNWS